MRPSVAAAEAWQPLPTAEWDAAAARHLLRRAGWSAVPAEVERALAEGLPATLDRLFPAEPIRFPEPELVASLQADSPVLIREVMSAPSEAEQRRRQRELRERSNLALDDMSLRWLRFAAQPDQAAFAKWVLFLSDVYVVGADKVKNASFIWPHFDLLARHGLGPAPTLTKAIARSPAMVIYLDLNQGGPGTPNENFARELFELFVLGEGHYTENDIKEAARAFTGYSQKFGVFRFVRRRHDAGLKTVFGQTGPFGGDELIDLAYAQPAAASFLPHELVKFYLSDEPLPPAWLATLGATWRSHGFSLRVLAQTFFGSRLFFAPEFRGNYLKSPLQFYLGLVQDLQLDVPPLSRRVLAPLRQMGQRLFYPPNVRGWVGGRSWINATTLAARRQLVESLFDAMNEDNLNADEQMALAAARIAGPARFRVETAWFASLTKLGPNAAAQRLLDSFLALPAAKPFHEQIRQFLATDDADGIHRLRRLRRATVTLLQSPEYQLC